MRQHGPALGETNAEFLEVKQTTQLEIEALVGQRGVAHCRSASLITFLKEFFDSQILIGRIAPECAPHELMPSFGSCFGKAIGQSLTKQMPIVVVSTPLLHVMVNRSGKKSDAIGLPQSDRPHEVGQTETRFAWWSILLAEQRYAFVEVGQKYVVAITKGLAEGNTEVCRQSSLVPSVKQVTGFIIQPQRFAGTVAFPGRKALHPIVSAGHAVVDTRNAPVAGGEAPGMEEVEPVDVANYFVNRVMNRMVLQWLCTMVC